MIAIRSKLWRGVGQAALVAGIVACAPGDTKKNDTGAPAAAAGAVSDPQGAKAGPAAPASSAGESGEAGAALVYDTLQPAARTQLRLQHLKGFLLIAQKELQAGHAPEAGALVGQGVLEVYTPGAADFGDFDVSKLKIASDALMDSKPDASAMLGQGLAALSGKQGPADAALVRQMLGICGGLVMGLVVDGAVDPIEYQHSFGAALSVKDAFSRAEASIRRQNPARAKEVGAEIDRLLLLWPATQAPATIPSPAQYAAQIARVELALSGL